MCGTIALRGTRMPLGLFVSKLRVKRALVSIAHPLNELQVLLWYGCNLARFSLAWTGWLLACRRRWRASLLSDQSQIELKGTFEGNTAVNQSLP